MCSHGSLLYFSVTVLVTGGKDKCSTRTDALTTLLKCRDSGAHLSDRPELHPAVQDDNCQCISTCGLQADLKGYAAEEELLIIVPHVSLLSDEI